MTRHSGSQFLPRRSVCAQPLTSVGQFESKPCTSPTARIFHPSDPECRVVGSNWADRRPRYTSLDRVPLCGGSLGTKRLRTADTPHLQGRGAGLLRGWENNGVRPARDARTECARAGTGAEAAARRDCGNWTQSMQRPTHTTVLQIQDTCGGSSGVLGSNLRQFRPGSKKSSRSPPCGRGSLTKSRFWIHPDHDSTHTLRT